VCCKYLAYKKEYKVLFSLCQQQKGIYYLFLGVRRKKMTLVARIKELAQEQSLTLAELERKLNFPNSSIRKWDQQNPGINKIQKVADYFDVSFRTY